MRFLDTETTLALSHLLRLAKGDMRLVEQAMTELYEDNGGQPLQVEQIERQILWHLEEQDYIPQRRAS